MKIYIYSRKSAYTGKGESVENQTEMCKEYISAKIPGSDRAEIVVYGDEGFSVKNTNRPQFQKTLRNIKLNKPGYVACYHFDHINCNVSDFSSLIEDLNSYNTSFVYIKEELDISEPTEKAMMYTASVFAQLERETITERIRDNMLMLARTGRWPGGTTPTGLTFEKIQEIITDSKIKTSCKLKDNPEELRTIDCTPEKFLELRNIFGVSKYPIKQGIRSRTGKVFSLLDTKKIPQNPVCYIADENAWEYFTEHHLDTYFEKAECSNKYGLLIYNKRGYRRKDAPGQDTDKWIVTIRKHKGRTSGKEWVAIQSILKDNIPTGMKPAIMCGDYFLPSGLIFCDKHQSRMLAKQRGGKGGSCELYGYICNNRLCGSLELYDCQDLDGQQTDDVVCEYFAQYTDENSGIYELLEKLEQDLQGQTRKSPLPVIGDRIIRCNSEMDNLINTLPYGNLGTTSIERVNARIMELDKGLASMKGEKKRL